MKKVILGLMAYAAITPAFAYTYYTQEELAGNMTLDQVRSLSPEQLQRRSDLADIAVNEAQRRLEKATCNFGKNAFAPPGTPSDPSC